MSSLKFAVPLCLLMASISPIILVQSEECESAMNAVVSLSNVDQQTANTIVHTNLTTSTGSQKCPMDETCCSSSAENYLRTDVTDRYHSQLVELLNDTFKCNNNDLIRATEEFIQASKTTLISGLDIATSQFGGLNGNEDIINAFFNYVSNGIVTLDLCNLATEFETMYFSVYSAVFIKSLAQNGYTLPTSASFNDCFYKYFNETQRSVVVTEYDRFSTRYNLFLRYLRALKTVNAMSTQLVNQVGLTDKCRDQLLKLTQCSVCAGYPSSLYPCPTFCSNVLRGCLVDYTELGLAYSELHQTLQSTREVMAVYDPFGAITALQSKLVNFIFNNVFPAFSTIKSGVESSCGVTFPPLSGRRRRSLPVRSHGISKRQSPDAAMAALDRTVTCISDISVKLRNLDKSLCDLVESKSTCDCWNGTANATYSYNVPDGDRISQLDNPQLFIQSDTGLKFKDFISIVKSVSSSIGACSSNVNTCPIQLCNISLPTAGDFDLGSLSRYNMFTSSGFPEPEIVVNSTCEIFEPPPEPSSSSTTTTTASTTSTIVVQPHTTSSTVIATTSSSELKPTTTVGDPDPNSSTIHKISLLLLIAAVMIYCVLV